MNKKGIVNIAVVFSTLFLILNVANSQTINSYNFGTSVASYVTAGTSNVLSTPPSGNAYVYIASGVNGGVHLKNPGLSTFGSGSKIMLHSSSSAGTSNKFSIYGHSGTTSSYVKFTIAISDSTGGSGVNDGVLYFCTGNGGSFSNNSSLSPGDIVTGLRWNISASGTISTDAIKSGNSWRSIDINPFYQGQSNVYTVEIFGNNSTSTVNYNYNGTSQSVATLKQDIYINGVLCANDADVSSNGLPVNTNINSFMFFAESNKANGLCAFIDDITYATGISTSYVTYTEYFAKSSGNLDLISSWTTNIDGSGTQYPPDFAGDIINGGGKVAMNFNLKNRSTATIGNNWNISGQNCKLKIGDGTNPVTLTIPSAYTFSAASIDLNNNAILKNQSSASFSFGTFNINSGASYQHDCNGGTIPTGTWNVGSLCNITGVTNSAPGGSGQAFYNFIWNCPLQSASVNLGGISGFGISGDLTISSTGGVSGRALQLTSNNTRSLAIAGSLNLNGGHLALTSGSGLENVNVAGNLILSNSSELYFAQVGSGTGIITLNGNITMNSGTLITETGSSSDNSLVFNNNGSQFISNLGTINNDINYTVNANSTLSIYNDIYVNTGRIFTVNGSLYCGNNNIYGNGSFTLSSGGLLGIGSANGIMASSVSGNVQVTGSRNYNSNATYIYNGTGAYGLSQQVTGDGIPSTVSNIIINNSSGVNLSKSTTVTNNLTLTSGILSIENYDLTISPSGIISGETSASYISTGGTGNLSMTVSNSNKTFPIGNGSYTPIILYNSGTTDVYSAKIKNTFDFIPLNYHVVSKQWTLSESVAGGSNLSITLQWNSGDENALFFRGSALYMGQYNGIIWETHFASNGVSGSGPYIVTATGFTQLNPIVLGNDESMPVELINFSAVPNSNNVRLSWGTAFEINNSGFDIERKISSDNEKNWKKIGFVKGKNNSNQSSFYDFNDKNPGTGSYNYRLKQIDMNGNYRYYNLQNIVEISSPNKFNVSQNYPNPFNSETKFCIDIPVSGYLSVILYDVGGREVYKIADAFYNSGFYELKFNANKLSSGIYYCRFKIKSGIAENSITKKISLLK